jgi:hypothetical protein
VNCETKSRPRLGPAEEVAAGTVEQHLLGKGQAPGRPGRAGADFINIRRTGGENFVHGTHPRIEVAPGRVAKEKECG